MGPLVGLLGVVLAVLGILYLAGERVPARTTARLCLWERLKSAGLGRRIPLACVNEIADHLAALPVDGLSAGWRRARAERLLLMRRVEAAGAIIEDWVVDARESATPGAATVLSILHKHGVRGGGL